MPFVGLPLERAPLFAGVEPVHDIPVSDAAAWRLNPAHRAIYNKLDLAIAQGVTAAPAGVDPVAFGLAPEAAIFVRPIINLHGMGVGARVATAAEGATDPGTFWCLRLEGEQVSSDCLVEDGTVRWFRHTRVVEWAGDGRPLLWAVGVNAPEVEPVITRWAAAQLVGYTGIANLELIGGTIIEAHLRGSNGFFEFYGADFFRAWVELVDEGSWRAPAEEGPGFIRSVFTDAPGPFRREGWPSPPPGVHVGADLDGAGHPRAGRLAIVRGRERDAVEQAGEQLEAHRPALLDYPEA
ncbi:MAG: hypothetical protein ACQERR_00435 [Pseudomonadota bacterium]